MNAQLEEAYTAGVMTKLAEYGLEELGGDDVFWRELGKVAQTNDLSQAAQGGPYHAELLRRNREIEDMAARRANQPSAPQPTAGNQPAISNQPAASNQPDTRNPSTTSPLSRNAIMNYLRGRGLVHGDGSKVIPDYVKDDLSIIGLKI